MSMGMYKPNEQICFDAILTNRQNLRPKEASDTTYIQI